MNGIIGTTSQAAVIWARWGVKSEGVIHFTESLCFRTSSLQISHSPKDPIIVGHSKSDITLFYVCFKSGDHGWIGVNKV